MGAARLQYGDARIGARQDRAQLDGDPVASDVMPALAAIQCKVAPTGGAARSGDVLPPMLHAGSFSRLVAREIAAFLAHG